MSMTNERPPPDMAHRLERIERRLDDLAHPLRQLVAEFAALRRVLCEETGRPFEPTDPIARQDALRRRMRGPGGPR